MDSSLENKGKTTTIEIGVGENALAYVLEPPPPYTETCTSSQSVFTLNQTVTTEAQLKHLPSFASCPACQKNVITRVEHHNTRKTHLAAGFIFGFTLWCMFCCLAAIPYIATCLKKTVHFCPNCNHIIATY